jgi:hypothetical protein
MAAAGAELSGLKVMANIIKALLKLLLLCKYQLAALPAAGMWLPMGNSRFTAGRYSCVQTAAGACCFICNADTAEQLNKHLLTCRGASTTITGRFRFCCSADALIIDARSSPTPEQ